MKATSILFGLFILSLALAGCKKGDKGAGEAPEVGSIYSITTAKKDLFKVVKILAVADKTIHLKVYVNPFSSRPAEIAESELSIGLYEHASLPGTFAGVKDGKTYLGITHLAIHKETWSLWEPKLLVRSKASEEELAPYRMWNGQTQPPRIKLSQ